MNDTGQRGPGLYFSPIIDLAERLVQLHLGSRQNAPGPQFDLEATVVAGSMPLTIDRSRNYVLEPHRLFLSYSAEGCQLLPHTALHEQEIVEPRRAEPKTSRRPGVKTKRSWRFSGKFKIPFVTAKGDYKLDDAANGEPVGAAPKIHALARYAAGGWEMLACDADGKPSKARSLSGPLLSGASENPEPIGTFQFDHAAENGSVLFEVRLPRGGLVVRPAEWELFPPSQHHKELAERAVETEARRNFATLKARVAGLIVTEAASRLFNSPGRDANSGELIVSSGVVEAVPFPPDIQPKPNEPAKPNELAKPRSRQKRDRRVDEVSKEKRNAA